MIGYWLSALFACTTVVGVVAYFLTKRRYRSASRQWKREDDLLNETSKFFHTALDSQKDDSNTWIPEFASFVMSGMDVDGVLIARQEHEKSDHFDVITAIGEFDYLKTQGEKVKQPRGTSAFAWTATPQRLNSSELRAVLPDGEQHGGTGLVGPLRMDPACKAFILLIRNANKTSFNPHDQRLLGQCINVAELGLALKFADDRIHQLEHQLQHAHEEGMLQVTSGLIHNIGNGIATIQVALERFKQSGTESLGEVVELLDNEIFPEMEKQLDAGTLQTFLTEDDQGKEYLEALKLLTSQINDLVNTHEQEMGFIASKFQNVTEIIDLQHRFIGELGTESMCSINSIINQVLTQCKNSLDKLDIDLKVDIQAEEQILVDRAMFHHIIAMLLQQAIEAARLTTSEKPQVRIVARSNDPDYEGKIVMHIRDNGVGQEIDLSDTARLRDGGSKARLLADLIFIRGIVEKYDGTFELKAKYGAGLDRIVRIPFNDDKDDKEQEDKEDEKGGNDQDDES